MRLVASAADRCAMIPAMPPGVSLKQHGLCAPKGLDCPSGGYHNVSEAEVILAAARRGGMALCIKCNDLIELAPAEQGENSAR